MFFVCLWSEHHCHTLFLDGDCRIWSLNQPSPSWPCLCRWYGARGCVDNFSLVNDLFWSLIFRRSSTAFSCFCPRTSHPTSVYGRTHSQCPKDSPELFTAYFAAASSSIYVYLGLGALLIWSNLVKWSKFILLLGARQYDFKSKHGKDVLLSKSDLAIYTLITIWSHCACLFRLFNCYRYASSIFD